jgi:hypothetical protein
VRRWLGAEATGCPSFRLGTTLTARAFAAEAVALSTASFNELFAFAIAALCEFAALTSSPSVIGSILQPRHGIFRQHRPKGEVASMTPSASASIVGGMSRPRALAVASGDKDVAH